LTNKFEDEDGPFERGKWPLAGKINILKYYGNKK
jgi:hypothetical protein